MMVGLPKRLYLRQDVAELQEVKVEQAGYRGPHFSIHRGISNGGSDEMSLCQVVVTISTESPMVIRGRIHLQASCRMMAEWRNIWADAHTTPRLSAGIRAAWIKSVHGRIFEIM